MNFGQPLVLWLLLLLPVLLVAMLSADRRARTRLERIAARRLLPGLQTRPPAWQQWLRRGLILVGLFCLAVALAKPRWGAEIRSVDIRGRDIFVALDCSKSMLATDVPPSRLERAKLVIEDLIRGADGDRVGLLAFAGEAEVVAPLTTDYDTLLDALAQTSPDSISRGGTDIAAAIRSAVFAFGHSNHLRALVLFSDGEELDEDSQTAAAEAARENIRIFTVGLGTAAGSTIPQADGRPLRDRQGNVVVTRLDETLLRRLAELTQGNYFHLESNASTELQSALQSLERSSVDQRSITIPIERFQVPLGIGLALLALGFAWAGLRFSRRVRATVLFPVAVAAILQIFALRASAAPAFESLKNGDYQEAYQEWLEQLKQSPSNPELNYNAGIAAYRLKSYDEAFELFSKALRSSDPELKERSYYNSGNTLFLKGDAQEDIEGKLTNYYDARYLYQQALQLKPNDEDARHNLELLEKRIKEAEQQKRQQQQNGRSRRKAGGKNQKGSNPSGGSQPDTNGSNPNQSQSDVDGGDSDQQDESDSGAEPTPTPPGSGSFQEANPNDQPSAKSETPQSGAGMTREEAMGLLDSMRNQDDHVNLNQKKRERPVLKDW